ncbi:hypothetical protein CCR98_10760 [Stenotrophomonas sp. WZN-1]|uniref:hypothetical protein n=1 Tax=Stenotrophomonas sp. WZN-1 TaxID=2005046 RepID=UPI000B439F26|nr:hypothetical protein [Stenotrophomonas sp. WZN-1]ARZ74635.1 hypothetical protein CCR98_10760 [Stenotrophomonas sp. WZN-1]
MNSIYALLHEAQTIVGNGIASLLEKDWLSAVATLAASFFGASFAFRYQQKEKDRERREKEIAQAGAALQCLFRMTNIVGGYKTSFVDPVREMGDMAAINLAASLSEDVSRERFDMASLSFLSGLEEQQLVADLWLEERRFRNLMQAIDRRSKLHLEQFQPKAEAHGLHSRGQLSLDEIRKLLGPMIVNELQRTTKFIIKDVDDTLESLDQVKTRFREVLSLRFPGQKFLNFELIDGHEDPADSNLASEVK